MNLTQLFEGIDYILQQGTLNIDISNIAYDSRNIKQGTLFFCIPGYKVDGHDFVIQAMAQGAIAVIVERPVEGLSQNITILQVNNSREVMGKVAAQFYGFPYRKMNMIGITGTNGKTTTTYLLSAILHTMEHTMGIIGTIENRIGDKVLKTSRTTPESIDLQCLFAQMVEEQVQSVAMEVSSHALELYRVEGCEFDVGVFTNLTQDHLDFHKTMENYRKAKAKLFQKCKYGVINADDPAAREMMKDNSAVIVTYGIDHKADLQAYDIHISSEGVSFIVALEGKNIPFTLKIPGKFSVYNALGAIGAALCLRVPIEKIQQGLMNIQGVPGRFQNITSQRGFSVIVDYAHTPDGLENILKTVQQFAGQRIITVFGCGGDRDRTKRPIMGEVAGYHSDFCIITSDNPRSEDPHSILNEIEAGVQKTHCSYKKIEDRREAIAFAIQMAQSADVVVIAGKGHEDYQILKDKTIHFNDVEVVKQLL